MNNMSRYERLKQYLRAEAEKTPCPRCGKVQFESYGMSGNPYSQIYKICHDCGGKNNDFTAYFYLEKEIHYQMRVGNSGHTDWIIKKRKQAFIFR